MLQSDRNIGAVLSLIRFSDPLAPSENLLSAAVRVLRSPHVIMPYPCKDLKEWSERCAALGLAEAPAVELPVQSGMDRSPYSVKRTHASLTRSPSYNAPRGAQRPATVPAKEPGGYERCAFSSATNSWSGVKGRFLMAVSRKCCSLQLRRCVTVPTAL